MERAETIAALTQRASWTKKHWTPLFSEMPLRILSLGSLRSPFAVIARTAENSAIFSALDGLDAQKRLNDERGEVLIFADEKPALPVEMYEV